MEVRDLMNKRIAVSMLLIIALFLSACRVAQKPTPDEQSSANEISTTPEIAEEQPHEDSFIETVSPEEIKTDWNTFECTYFGDIPVGLLTVPDATVTEVEKYINLKLDTNYTLSTHELHNAYKAYQVEVDDVFNLYGHKGQAVFEFDWAGTLSNIVFTFYDDADITPATMMDLHTELSHFLGVERDWLLNNIPAWDNSTDCFWSTEYDDTPFDVRLSTMFSETRPVKNDVEFERTVASTKMNYEVVDETDGKTTDKIIYNGLTIKAKYHTGSNPYVDGTATNNSDTYVEFVRIKVLLYNSSGNVIDTEWTYAVGAEGLAPGETTKWIVYCSNADEMRISIMK